MEKYQKYLRLKEKFKYEYRGIMFDGVMSLRLWDYANYPEVKDNFRWKSNMKIFAAYRMADITFDKD